MTRLGRLLGLVTLLTACGGGGTEKPEQPQPGGTPDMPIGGAGEPQPGRDVGPVELDQGAIGGTPTNADAAPSPSPDAGPRDAGAGGASPPVDDAGPPPVPADAGVLPAPPPGAPLRRLTRVEYANTLQDLLGEDGDALAQLPPDVIASSFDNQAEAQSVPTLLAERYLELAEQIADRVTADPQNLAPCAAGADAEGCARDFLDGFLPRAFRRPLEPGELDRFVESYRLGATDADYAAGLASALVHTLTSPHFLYRVEFGGAPTDRADGTEVVPATPWEVATRLSYFLWRSMPDEALRLAADANALSTPEQIAAEAERMLNDPRSRAMVEDFHAQWLGIQQIIDVEKEAVLFPEFDAVRATLRDETLAFVTDVFFEDPEGTLTTLLTASHGFVGPETAAIYGVEAPAAPRTRVALDPTVRSGILTQPAVLAVHAQSTRTSPVLRGHFVREALLCGGIPEPPPGTDTSVPRLDPMNPNFDEDPFAVTMENPECVGCHRLMNPIGWGLEAFDPIGRHVPVRGGRPVETAGELLRTDVDGPFEGPVELAARLARSGQVADCLTGHWYTFAHGHRPGPGDAPYLAAAQAHLRDGGALRDLLLELVKTEAFRLR